jgi:hypothetical protein
MLLINCWYHEKSLFLIENLCFLLSQAHAVTVVCTAIIVFITFHFVNDEAYLAPKSV